MSSKKNKITTTTDKTESQNAPFVNEECGDTMWDVVLQEAEERLKKAVMVTPEDGSAGKLPQEVKS